jgi:hypothetical protein
MTTQELKESLRGLMRRISDLKRDLPDYDQRIEHYNYNRLMEKADKIAYRIHKLKQ